MTSRKRALSFEQLKPDKGVPYSRQWLSTLEKAGKFPKRIRIGARVAWLEHEIDAWLEACAAESRADNHPPAPQLEEATAQ